MQKINDYQKIQVGYALVTHNKSHIGLITDVQKDENDIVTSFTFTHNEGHSGKVVSTEIFISEIGQKKEKGNTVNTYEENIVGIYKWDDLPSVGSTVGGSPLKASFKAFTTPSTFINQ